MNHLKPWLLRGCCHPGLDRDPHRPSVKAVCVHQDSPGRDKTRLSQALQMSNTLLQRWVTEQQLCNTPFPVDAKGRHRAVQL